MACYLRRAWVFCADVYERFLQDFEHEIPPLQLDDYSQKETTQQQDDEEAEEVIEEEEVSGTCSVERVETMLLQTVALLSLLGLSPISHVLLSPPTHSHTITRTPLQITEQVPVCAHVCFFVTHPCSFSCATLFNTIYTPA